MKDNNYNFKREVTPEGKINNLKEILALISQKLDMNLQYIDVESIIQNSDKESAKYILILYINVLKANENYNNKINSLHFNNDIEILKKSFMTERDEKEIKNKNKYNKKLLDMSLTFDPKTFNRSVKKNATINEQFDQYLMNIARNMNINIEPISKQRPYSSDKYNKRNIGKKTDLKIFYIPPVRISDKKEEDLKNNYRLYSVNRRGKNYFHLFLSKKELIYEVIKIVKDTIPNKDFYDFIVNYSFTKKMLNIIEKIYYLHFLSHRNLSISKHFLKDHRMDISTIILIELGLYEKLKKPKSNNKNNMKQTSYNNFSNRNIKELSKLFKDILWIKKFNDFNYIRIEHEIKESEINYNYIRKINNKYIENFKKLFLKLISVEENKNDEDKEFENFLFNIKFYQILDPKADVIKNLRNKNKELKILKKNNLLI